jgi:ADP-sugar diphosphatase
MSGATESVVRKPTGSKIEGKPSTKVGKIDNSASMQRAIDRVSKERTVKQNAPSTIQKTIKAASSKVSGSSSKKVKSSVTSAKSSTPFPTSLATKVKNNPTSPKSKDAILKKDLNTAKPTKDLKNKRVGAKVIKKPPKVKSATYLQLPSEENKMGINVIPTEQTIDDARTEEIVETPVIKEDDDEMIKENLSLDIEKKASADLSFHFEIPLEQEARDESRDLTRKLVTDILRDGDDELSFEFQGCDVPVTYSTDVTFYMATMALESSPFNQWQNKMGRVVGTKHLEIRHIEIHSVDFLDEKVDMIKMKTTCALIDEEVKTEEEILSGVCYLRDSYVGVLLELFCIEDETSWSILVDKPRIPIGSVTALELPVGRVDEEEERLFGFEINEIEEAFGLQLYMSDLTNLTEEAYAHNSINNELGMCPSPGHSGEHVKIVHLKKEISKDHLLLMRSKFSEQREQGALVSLRVVPLNEMWKVSADMKIMCALFLLEKANLQEDDFDDDMSVSIRGKRFVSSMISNVRRGKSFDL